MKKLRFTESQIVSILKEREAGVGIAELARKHGISRATCFNWRWLVARIGQPARITSIVRRASAS